jgi:cystathionine beta-synthase
MFVGYTSGAAMQAIHQLAKQNYFKKTSHVVVIFPDHGSRYMSKIYSEKWMAEQGFFDADNQSNKNIEYINDQASRK